MPAESSSAQACEIPLMAAPTRPPPHPPIRFSRPPLTPTHTSVQGTKRRIKITKKLKQNVLVFGVSSVESLGEAVLNSSPSWAAGGRPRGSFFFFFCVCVWVERGRGGGGMNTGWWGRRWGMRGGWGSLLRFPPSAIPAPPGGLATAHRLLPPLVSGEGWGWLVERVF